MATLEREAMLPPPPSLSRAFLAFACALRARASTYFQACVAVLVRRIRALVATRAIQHPPEPRPIVPLPYLSADISSAPDATLVMARPRASWNALRRSAPTAVVDTRSL